MAFKVEFRNNVAVRATKQGKIEPWDIVEFSDTDGTQFIQTLFLEAENEQNALEMAQKIAKDIWRINPQTD